MRPTLVQIWVQHQTIKQQQWWWQLIREVLNVMASLPIEAGKAISSYSFPVAQEIRESVTWFDSKQSSWERRKQRYVLLIGNNGCWWQRLRFKFPWVMIQWFLWCSSELNFTLTYLSYLFSVRRLLSGSRLVGEYVLLKSWPCTFGFTFLGALLKLETMDLMLERSREDREVKSF